MRPVKKDALLFVILGSGFLFSATGWSVTGADRSQRSPSEIFVEEMRGDVDVATDGVAQEIAVGSVIGLPSQIATGSDGNISIRQSRTGVSIGPDSAIEIPAAAREGQLIARMVQHRGTVFYDVEPRPIEKLRIETPNLVAVVKGTQFSVVADADGTTVSLFEGVLELRSLDEAEVVEIVAGQIAIGSIDGGIRVLPMNADLLDETAAVDASQLADSSGRTIDAVGSTADVAALAGLPNVTLGDDETAASATVALGTGPLQAAAAVSGDIDTDLTGGSVDVGLDAGLDAGADLGGGSVEAGLDTGLDAGADLGGGSVDVGLDAGLDGGGDLVEDLVDELDSGLDEVLDLGGDDETDTDLGDVLDLGSGDEDGGLIPSLTLL